MNPVLTDIKNYSGVKPETDNMPEQGTAYAFFQKIQRAMSCFPNFSEICKGILNTVVEEIEAENCSLMLKDPFSEELTIFMARGQKDSQWSLHQGSQDRGARFKSGEGIAGRVFEEGFSLVVGDTDKELKFINKNGSSRQIKSICCFPVREREEVVGVFNLSHSRYQAFGEWERLAMSYVVNQIGAALTASQFFFEKNAEGPFSQKQGDNPSFSGKGIPGIITEAGSTENSSNNGEFVFYSAAMKKIDRIIDQIADTNVTVFIQGESGVGKEVVARSLHQRSSRRDQPFTKVNCAALPSELLESELFGYEKGAFTGAYRQKPGKFELAQGGTIFLDEIAEITPALQAKLLQVLQDGEFSRLGGKKDIKVDVRIISATNKNIDEALKKGRFREDFY
ncbi:MAG: sigma 54-interacting transcriptional regulator, partial [Thermodesulfobacteriota bacterium]